MAFAYTIKDDEGVYFVTFTVVQWIAVFTRQDYVNILLDSLRFCQKEKGLLVYAWVVMSNHVHLIMRSDSEPLSEVIKDIKKNYSNSNSKSHRKQSKRK